MLGFARIVFGSLVLLRTTPLLALLHLPYLDDTGPLLGWPTTAWRVAAFGLALPPGVVAALCVARTLAAILFTIGVRVAASGIAGGVLGWIVLSQDAMGYINTLHLLFLGMVVLGAGGAGAFLALRPDPVVDPSSGVALVRALVVSVYLWSGLAKLNGSWLSGGALAQLYEHGMVRATLAEPLLTWTPGRTATAWAIAAIELTLGPLLLWTRSRRVAVVAALTLHAGLEAAVHPDFFGFAMAALLLSFVSPRVAASTGTNPPIRPSVPATR